jgi:hypothetical protein
MLFISIFLKHINTIFVPSCSGSWIHMKLMILNKMSLKEERVSICKFYIEVKFVTEENGYILI